MSLQYILDGYNIIKQIPPLKLKKLRDGRDSLVSLIEIYRPQGSIKNSVTIVFDGQSGIIGYPNPLAVKVLFSSDESADDKIKRIVSESNRKKETIVVTDDRELQFSVRLLGAKILSVADFLAQAKGQGGEGPASKGQKPKAWDEKTISKTLEYKINSEFEKIWLKK
ncbi:MAG TPA: NYN domain-containing protein [Candidatus Omnitrophota bacterium]|nr:NYN domain-containing protein [Candidatus Omnitrophota bacterium]HPD84216.1 NYN domain-containing protein [Candidatus Omnitrophota bacterium]HRZ03072.1 NYN domain-containing protein [Candidatus Omnitrophota bacterium]